MTSQSSISPGLHAFSRIAPISGVVGQCVPPVLLVYADAEQTGRLSYHTVQGRDPGARRRPRVEQLAARRDFLENFNAMRDRADDKAEAFHGAARFARQTDHERLIDDDGQVA